MKGWFSHLSPSCRLQGVLQGEEPQCSHEESRRAGEEGRGSEAEGEGGCSGRRSSAGTERREWRRGEGLRPTGSSCRASQHPGPGTSREGQERVTWTLLCKTNPIMKNKQALLFTKAKDSVKGCRIQFSEYLVCLELFCFLGALRGQGLWNGEELGSASLISAVAAVPPSSQVLSEPPWQAKPKPSPWQHYSSFSRGPGRLCNPFPEPPRRDSLESGGLNTHFVFVQSRSGRSCSNDPVLRSPLP